MISFKDCILIIIYITSVNCLLKRNVRNLRSCRSSLQQTFREFFYMNVPQTISLEIPTNDIEHDISFNTKMRIESFTDFYNRKPEVPNIQREYDEGRFKEFYDNIIN